MLPNQRSLGLYYFEDGAIVQILVTNEVSTEDALNMVETLIALKRKELELQAQTEPTA